MVLMVVRGSGQTACLTDPQWLDKQLVAFFFFFSSPLPVTLTGLLQEGQFLETTLQGYSVAFWKA